MHRFEANRADQAGKKKGKKMNPSDTQAAIASKRLGIVVDALQEFTGHDVEVIETHLVPEISHAWALGPIERISYIATRDGETAIYEHEFKESSRPLLVASTDGDQLVIVGGQYQVTERGIVDR